MATTTNSKAAVAEASEAEQQWLEAKKITLSINKKLEQIDKDESGSKKLLAELDSVEHLLESLRLACMATTFTDFKFAHHRHVLGRLWHVHTLISAEYKKGLQRHRGHGQIVQFRTIEKQYAKHLKTAQYFYKGFIERLSARYRLRPLQRVAHRMQSGNLKINDVIDADEAHLSHELTVACYRTVLHMGDIARYRLNASRQKGHSPDVAMTYYALAQDLMPQEGDAHHQMGVVLAEHRRDFDVVYHFLRSWSVQKPSTLAPTNMASEFKKLLQPPPNSRKQGNAPPDAHDLFGTWLVRLHANYFKGEEFSSQSELEREVLHRWEALLKKSEQPDYLMKAILMNIAAYDIGLKRVKDEWSAATSRSCQFILQFIVRTILVLSRVLESEIEHVLDEPLPEEEPEVPAAPAKTASPARNEKNEKNERNEKNSRANGRNRGTGNNNNNNNNAKAAATTDNNPKSAAKKQSVAGTCLSLFRVCVAWISLHDQDLVKFEAHLTPYIADMHRSVTRCLTHFVDLITKQLVSPTNYLLPEDVEIVGLAPLDNWTALRESDSNSPFKPHFDEEGVERKGFAYETLARIYDVVESSVRLIGDTSFPWVLEQLQEDGHEVTKISYAEDRASAPASTGPLMSMPASAPAVSASYVAASAATASASPAPAIMRSGGGREPRQRGQRQKQQQQQQQQQPEAAAPAVQVQVQASPAPVAPTVTVEQISQPVLAQQPIGAPANIPHQADGLTRPMPSPRRVSYKDMDDDDFLPGSMKEQEPRLMTMAAGQQPVRGPPTADAELDFLESAAYSRVANFLSPPELHPHPSQATPLKMSPASPSYGMHSSTVDDVFGQLQTPNVSGVSNPTAIPTTANSSASKPIPSSPWGGSSYMHSLGYYSPQQQQQQMSYGMGGLGGMERPPPASIEDQLAYLTLAKQQERAAAAATANAPSASQTSGAVPMQNSSSSYGMDSLSRGFPSALSPVGGSKHQPQQHNQSPLGQNNGAPGSGFNNPWAAPTNNNNNNNSRLLPQQLQQTQAASLGVGGAVGMGGFGGLGGIGGGLGGQPAPASPSGMLYSSNFTMNNSMPSVQSSRAPGGASGGNGFFDNSFESIYGSSAGTGGNYQSQQQQLQQLQQMQQIQQLQQMQQMHHLQQQQQQEQQRQQMAAAYGGYGDYTDRLNGTSASAAAAIGSPSGTSSAMWQDAATAWGRGGPLGKDDPTHFRNSVHHALLEDSNAYDRNALLSALDDKNSPSQR